MSYLDAISYGASLFVKASVILAVVWVVAFALRRRSAALRHLLWGLALTALLALPVMSTWVPSLEVDVSRLAKVVFSGTPDATTGDAALSSASHHTLAADDTQLALPVPLAIELAEPAAGADRRLFFSVLFVWLCGIGAQFLVFLVHLVRIWSVTAAAVSHEGIQVLATDVALRLHLSGSPRVRVGRVASPIVWGLLRPVVLLPEGAMTWSTDRLQTVLMHEFAHLRRYDYAVHVLAEFTCALYWPNPLVWFARYRLQAEQERACDDAVLRNGIPSHVYAEHLLGITRSARNARTLSAGLRMAKRSGLKDRIRAILDPHMERSSVSVGGFCLVLLAVTLPAVSASVLRTGGDPSEATAAVPGTERPPVFALTVEAEDGHVQSPMEVFEDERASGGRYVMVPDGEGNDPPEGGPGLASLRLELQETAYYWIWARVIGDHHNDNSFFVTIDEREEVRWDIFDADGDYVHRWTWLPVTGREGVHLQRGLHDMTFRNREDDSRLDAVFVSTDPDLVPRGRSPMPPPEEPFTIAFEAEQPLEFSAPLEIRTDEDASRRLYIAAADGSESLDATPETGRAVYAFDVPWTGKYVVWGRVVAPNHDADSFWIRMNGEAWVRWNGIKQDDEWTWQLVHDADDGKEDVRFPLYAGRNVLEIAYREDGAKIDRFLVTNDPYAHPDDGERGRSDVTVIFND